MQPVTAAVLALFIAAGLALLWLTAARDQRRANRWRAGLLDDCRVLLDEPTVSMGIDRHPCLSGLYKACPTRLRVFTDTLVTRRLPQLWCESVIDRPTGLSSTIGVLVRPTGAEYYAVTHRLPRRHEAPASWPGNLIIRSDAPIPANLLARIEHALAPALADARVKEIVVGPRRASIIWQACEGERGPHLVLRQCVFPIERLAADEVADRLQALVDFDPDAKLQQPDPVTRERVA